MAYEFSDQQKDFVRLQFIYASKLKKKLDSGAITQAYYDQNVWLTAESLQNPDTGWEQEFVRAIDQEDLIWLEGVIGDKIKGVAEAIGTLVGTVVGSAVGGVSSGISGAVTKSLGLSGWITLIVAGAVLYLLVKYKKIRLI